MGFEVDVLIGGAIGVGCIIFGGLREWSWWKITALTLAVCIVVGTILTILANYGLWLK